MADASRANATTGTPVGNAPAAARRRLGLRGEFALALLPTTTVLLVLAFVDAVARQRMLFASLASSAFLIYLAPGHPTNRLRTLLIAQGSAALLGWALVAFLGQGYAAAAGAMVLTIAVMITADAVHPPAVSTALSFALGAGQTRTVVLFGVAVGVTAALVVVQGVTVRLLARLSR